MHHSTSWLWPPCVADADIIFLSCFFLLSSFFFPRLISAVADWMSTILLHMVWPYSANLECRSENVLHAARWKRRTQKIVKNSPFGHHRTTLTGYIFAIKARTDSRKKYVEQQCLPHMSSEYSELRPTSDWDLLSSLGHPSKFQRVSHIGRGTARHSCSGRQPKFAALSTGRHLYSAGRPSRWASAHFLVLS